jgi:hypothetical protein
MAVMLRQNEHGRRLGAADIAEALEESKLEVLRHLFPNGTIRGHEFEVGDLQGNPGRSLKVCLSGKGPIWSDFGTGESGGDLLELWARARCDGDIGTAMREVSTFLGLGEKRTAKSKAKSKSSPTADALLVSPIPPDAPPSPERHPELGAPAMRHKYFNENDRRLLYVNRYVGLAGKEIRPLTLWRTGDRLHWEWKAHPTPRPIYRLNDLAKNPHKPVLVVEGEKTADAAAECFPELAVTTWAGGANAVDHADISPLAGRDVTLWPDADDAGQRAMERFAERLFHEHGTPARIVQIPGGLPSGFDLADQWPDSWNIDVVQDLIDAATERVAPVQQSRIGAIWFGDLELGDKVEWLSQGLLPSGGFSVMYGHPGCGKSFLATDLATRTAIGWAWLGAKCCAQGLVAYVASEGGNGVKKRFIGLSQYLAQPQSSVPLLLIPRPINMLDDGEVSLLIAELQNAAASRKASFTLIVVDTLSRSFAGGNENAPDDMGTFVANCDRVRRETGAAVLVVHHDAKDGGGRGGRGHSILQGAADTIFKVERDQGGTGPSCVIVEKQKDAQDGQRLGFHLQQIEVGKDQEGRPITTCVVELSDVDPQKSAHKIGGIPQRALSELADLILECGCSPPACPHIPPSRKVVTTDQWKDRLARRQLINPDGNPRQQLKRIQITLQKCGAIGIWDQHVWIAQS